MKRRRRKQRYGGVQIFILVCFFVIVIVSVTLTGLLIGKSRDWAEPDESPAPETEVTETEEPETLPPAEETEPETEVPAVPEEETEKVIIVPKPVVPDDGAERAENSRPEWNLILVNKWNPLPEDFDFTPNMFDLLNGHYVDKRMYPDLQEMMDDARATGIYPIISSSYRSMEKQETLYVNQVKKYLEMGYTDAQAHEQASEWIALPGTTEHHTGLAVDIVALDYQLLDENQEQTPEQQWLMENSWKYGFILRYPNGKSDLTGVTYEPWHYRYVGRGIAEEIYTQGLCLEEYLLQLQ